jgi:hypothetical protein
MYIGDYGNGRLRRVDLATGMVTTVAGTGTSPVPYDAALTGENTPLNRIIAVAMDGAGNVYMPVFYTDLGTLIMRLDASGTMTRIAGGGESGTADVPATDLLLPSVESLEINPISGALLVGVGDGRVFSIPDVATPTAS